MSQEGPSLWAEGKDHSAMRGDKAEVMQFGWPS